MLCIDMGSSVLKILDVRFNQSRLVIERFFIEPIDSHEAMIHFLSNLNKESKKTCIALSDAFIVRKIIQVGAGLSCSDVESLVHMEACRLLGLPSHEVAYDFYDHNRSNAEMFKEILMVACPKIEVMNAVGLIEAAGLEVSRVDVQSFALERSFRRCLPGLWFGSSIRTIATFDIGVHELHALIFHEQEWIFFCSKPINGHVYESILTGIQELLAAFFVSHPSIESIDTMLVSGGVCLTPNLVSKLNQTLNIPIQLAHVVENMVIGAEVNGYDFNRHAVFFTKAAGIALGAVS